jgi:hypothetical protein
MVKRGVVTPIAQEEVEFGELESGSPWPMHAARSVCRYVLSLPLTSKVGSFLTDRRSGNTVDKRAHATPRGVRRR